MNRGVLSFCSLALAAGLLLAPTAEAGFHRAKIGMVIANIELPALSGDRQACWEMPP